jgi:diaminopimelate epimerase
MGCTTCGGGAAAAAAAAENEVKFEVTLPSGETRILNDHDSRVAITMAGGGERREIKK